VDLDFNQVSSWLKLVKVFSQLSPLVLLRFFFPEFISHKGLFHPRLSQLITRVLSEQSLLTCFPSLFPPSLPRFRAPFTLFMTSFCRTLGGQMLLLFFDVEQVWYPSFILLAGLCFICPLVDSNSSPALVIDFLCASPCMFADSSLPLLLSP